MEPGTLEGLESLGNVGVIPLVIFLTQLIKKKIGDFKYGSDVLALILSFTLCIGWEFYYMSSETYVAWAALNGLNLFKWFISNIVLVGFGTWLAASKVYDLIHGNKRRTRAVAIEKGKLEEEIIKLKNGNGESHEQTVEESDLSSRLRKILEEGR